MDARGEGVFRGVAQHRDRPVERDGHVGARPEAESTRSEHQRIGRRLGPGPRHRRRHARPSVAHQGGDGWAKVSEIGAFGEAVVDPGRGWRARPGPSRSGPRTSVTLLGWAATVSHGERSRR